MANTPKPYSSCPDVQYLLGEVLDEEMQLVTGPLKIDLNKMAKADTHRCISGSNTKDFDVINRAPAVRCLGCGDIFSMCVHAFPFPQWTWLPNNGACCDLSYTGKWTCTCGYKYPFMNNPDEYELHIKPKAGIVMTPQSVQQRLA
jgi:hypothetical protein